MGDFCSLFSHFGEETLCLGRTFWVTPGLSNTLLSCVSREEKNDPEPDKCSGKED